MEIENYREELPGQAVIATFDVYLPKMQLNLRNFRLIKSKKGHLFVTPPSFKDKSLDGERWIPLIEFSRDKQKEFLNKILGRLKAEIPSLSTYFG